MSQCKTLEFLNNDEDSVSSQASSKTSSNRTRGANKCYFEMKTFDKLDLAKASVESEDCWKPTNPKTVKGGTRIKLN